MARGLSKREPHDNNHNNITGGSPNLPPSLSSAAPSGYRKRQLPPLPFRSVNRFGSPDHDPGLQRHHLLPLQLVARQCFGRLFDAVRHQRIGFDDFRRNGLLLPADDRTAVLMALPLHRGPHRRYNAMVIERVGQIEASWALTRRVNPDRADSDALFRLKLLQGALRRRLLDPRGRRFALNTSDPALSLPEFTHIDAMIEVLWAEPLGDQPKNGAELPASSAFASAYSAASLSTRSVTESMASTAPMPCPQPQMSFHAFASEFPPEPKIHRAGVAFGQIVRVHSRGRD